MSRRLDTRIDSAVRNADRITVKPTTTRTAASKSARGSHKATRTGSHPTAVAKTAKGASMDYQMGFTSGPSV